MHASATQEFVPYLGRMVPKRGFRAFIHHSDGRKKIAESYDEFELFINSDGWFATQEEAEAPKKRRKKTEE